MAVQEEHGLRLTNEIRTEPARMEQATIRMPVDSALQMALNIVDHISENMPEALKRVGIKVGDPRQERGKKK